MAFILGPMRFPLVPWGDISVSDLREAGPPELQRDIRTFGTAEKHLCLLVKGQYVPTLGMIAVRCERHSGWLLPLTLAIVDTTAVIEDEDCA